MTIRRGDKVAIKPGGKAEFLLQGHGRRQESFFAAELEAARVLDVSFEANRAGNVSVTHAQGSGDSLIHRDQLVRVFAGDFREGDKVVSRELGVTGVVVDADPASEEIKRAEKVPVKIASRVSSTDRLLQVGAVVYTDPSYLAKAPSSAQVGQVYLTHLPKSPNEFPRVELKDWLPDGSSVAFGGAGHIHIPSNHGAPSGVDLSVPDPTPSPAYKDVTDEVAGDWSRVAIGDVVTAKHKTQARGGVQITNERTAEVVKDDRGGWGSGDMLWCELNLTMHQSYDAHKITRVLRLQEAKLLSTRRNPQQVTVTRLVPADHVWRPVTRRCDGPAYVESDQGGSYWLVFEGGENSGKRIRLKEGRDSVQYESIQGTYVVRENFESLVALTHNPE